MDLSTLLSYARPQVKAALRSGDSLWLGTHGGLFKVVGQRAVRVEGWEAGEVKALGPAPIGFYLVYKNEHGECEIHRCNSEGRSAEILPPVPGGSVKAITGLRSVWAGTKKGVFEYVANEWVNRYDRDPCDVLKMEERDGSIWVSCKKLGENKCPAVISTRDGGQHWDILWEGAYNDVVLAANEQMAVCRWRHKIKKGENTKYKKTPITSALLGQDGQLAVIDGHKLRVERPNHSTLEAKHPIFAEAELLALENGRAVVAGGHGAYILDFGTGSVQDLFAGIEIPCHAFHIKKLYALTDSAFLATTSFGTFRSADNGQTWQPVAGEWAVHDAEGLIPSMPNHFIMACQRGLFVGKENGRHWKHEKLETNDVPFLEFTSIATDGEMFVVASKNGAFLGRCHAPKHLTWVKALEGRRMVGVTAETKGHFIAAADDNTLYTISAETLEAKARVTLPSQSGELKTLASINGRVLVATKNKVFEMTGDQLIAMNLPLPGGSWESAATSEALLIWQGCQAWLRRDEAWVPIADWPEKIKKVCFSLDGQYILATNRETIHRIEAPSQSLAQTV